MKPSILTLLLIFPLLVFSQTKLSILDSLSKKPIPFAEVHFHIAKKAVLTDSLGQLSTYNRSPQKLTVKCLGYETKTISFSKNHDKIWLAPKENKLDEVIVGAPKKVVNYGFHENRKTFLPTRGSRVNKSFYPAVYIPNPKPGSKSYIKSVKAYIRTKDKNEVGKIRLHLYRFDSSTRVLGKELLQSNFIFKVTHQRGLKTFNIKAEHIQFPQTGILIAPQLVNDAKSLYIRCGKNNDIKAPRTFLVPSFKKRKYTLKNNTVHKFGFDKQYPLMIGISVEQF